MALDKEWMPFDMCCMGKEEGGGTNKTQCPIL
ncbi:hypothetical protein COLO4_36910 [Corchorus olitorius]|uniref:Uncharacterized protein n=1 Tax=Corchorus olitorius TaxID=93759 RepID=A0A1R3G4D1_9ROSI|nr:hypothetical protein COLO4_36910 [Corchorus olitorius]